MARSRDTDKFNSMFRPQTRSHRADELEQDDIDISAFRGQRVRSLLTEDVDE